MTNYKPLLVFPLMFAVIIPIAMNQQFDSIYMREETSKKCNEFFYERNGMCTQNTMFGYNYNTEGFKEYIDKKVYGRIVQIETGNYITLESGQSFAVSDGFDDVWINDIVEVDKIVFEPIACQLTSLQFNNGTKYFIPTAPDTKGSWVYGTPLEDRIIISNKEMESLARSYNNQLDEKLGIERYSQYGSNFVMASTSDNCKQEPVYKVKKLQSTQQSNQKEMQN